MQLKGQFSALMTRRCAVRFSQPACRQLAVVMVLVLGCFGRSRVHYGEGFDIDLDQPIDVVLKAVRGICDDGVIRGTNEYRDSDTLPGAEAEPESSAFSKWKEGGTVLYKVRHDTLSPNHFKDSNDKGTVTVRYIVQPRGPNSSHLRIDAVFVEDSRMRAHASDGRVEENEFEAVRTKIADDLEADRKRRSQELIDKQLQEVNQLQSQLDAEKAQLANLQATEQQLRDQVRELQGSRSARVGTEGADLKEEPFTAANTLRILREGETVNIVQRTLNWDQIESDQGERGWVYRLSLQEAE